jgi:uroporphyrinogen-III synthase
MSPWLITRATEEATPLVERLQLLGLAAFALPCIERRAIAWVPDVASWSTRETLFMVSSPFGARRLAAYWPQLEGHGKVAALAPSTAAVMERAGIDVEISAPGGALGLAQAVARRVAGKGAVIVWLTSAAGLVEPEQQEAASVLTGVAELHRIVAYETRSPDGLGDELKRWHGVRAAAVFFSPSACRNYLAARNASGTGPVLERIACIGQSTLRSWTQLRPRGLPAAVYQRDEEAFVAWAAPPG